MSLQITSTIQDPQGNELTNLYGRVAVVNSYMGDKIESGVSLFKDEQAWLDGKAPYQLPEINLAFATPYEYEPGTVNILDLAHDVLVAQLAAQGITAVKNL